MKMNNGPESTSQIVTKWRKGVPDPKNDRINHWSLNGFGEPVFTGGLYSSEEIRTLEATVKDYCASKNVTPAGKKVVDIPFRGLNASIPSHI
jgi:hypothetical protein